ncbi:acetylxylan esterase [Parapedobacter indicus]|uniref:Cephalosporin-C deacetylase n=1 Tax=Parapedobacter indicus TaxID=1477437 RepID=A0A1I3RSR2_9SPHI|nr:acetylxylan esterase [Parapedobacter indicus]PPL00015.1 cephalosporin-C deacetylase-like acetyl esterase [Parapedobacter indicus]SFJ48952.1 Cephalosporin-C deacetylase [Parapedobacter indicus]
MNRLSFIRSAFAICGALFLALTSFAQSRPPHPIQVLVSPDKPDWTYAPGEEATFTIRILKHQVPMEDVAVTYTLGPEKMQPVNQGTLKLKGGTATVKGKLTDPGFLRCEARITVDGTDYRGLATAGYAPESIQPTQTLPADFWEFWDHAKAEAAKMPLDAKLTLLPERCTERADVYQVNIQNYETGSRIYGILAKPKAPGKYPAVLQVPGAGIRPYYGIVDLAEKGVITLQVGIHGIPVIYETGLYDDLRAAALKNYQFFNMDDRNQYYYKRVYLGCVRAIDYLFSLPEFDGSTLAVWGGSQGGALSIVTTALDNRVKYLVSLYPALCDLTGYLHGRAGGWPHMFNESNAPFMAKDDKIKVSAYYDVVNFAKSVKVPGFYTWGYNDETCPPTSFYSAYNQIKAPKELFLMQETGHWTFPEQQTKIQEWLLKQLVK